MHGNDPNQCLQSCIFLLASQLLSFTKSALVVSSLCKSELGASIRTCMCMHVPSLQGCLQCNACKDATHRIDSCSMHTHTHSHTYTHTHTTTHTHAHTNTHNHTHTRSHKHTQLYTYTHTLLLSCLLAADVSAGKEELQKAEAARLELESRLDSLKAELITARQDLAAVRERSFGCSYIFQHMLVLV